MSYNTAQDEEREPLMAVQRRDSPEGASEHSSYQERDGNGTPKIEIDILTQSGSHIVVKSENLHDVDLSARTT